jgi:hypothetical protein
MALFENGFSVFLKTLDGILTNPGSPSAKVGAIIDQVEGGLSDQRFQLIGAMFQNPEMHSRMSEWRDYQRKRWDVVTRHLAEVIEQGKADGDFDSALPTPLIMTLLLGLLTPFTLRRLVEENGMTSADIVKGLRRFFFKGITYCEHAPPLTP